MSLKYVKIPAPAVLGKQAKRDADNLPMKDDDGKVVLVDVECSLRECAEYIVDNDEQFARPASHIRAGARILKAFDTDKPYIELKEEDWVTLNKAFEEPSAGYGSWSNFTTDKDGKVIAAQAVKIAPRTFLDLINAVSEAVNTEPKPPKEEAKAAPAEEQGAPPVE